MVYLFVIQQQQGEQAVAGWVLSYILYPLGSAQAPHLSNITDAP